MTARGRPLMSSPILSVGSVLFAAAASTLLLVLPVYDGECVGVADYGAGGTHCPAVSHATLLQENGPGVLWVLVAPVALAALGAFLRARWARVAAAVTLGAFSLLTGFSIGSAYLPATLAMAFAARRTPRRQRSRTAGAA